MADHGRPPPAGRHRVLLTVLALAIVAGLVGGMVASRPDTGLPVGVGDPYYPDAGSPGWDALSYSIALTWDPDREYLDATTTIEAVATSDLTAVGFDLLYPVTAASIDGVDARSERSDRLNRSVVPVRPIPSGQPFTLVVSYAGYPGRLGGQGYVSSGDEAVFAGEPESSAFWFPANDHPSDPATMEVFATVPTGLEAVSIGTLVSTDADDDPATATWHWIADEPAATYLTFLAIGQYEVRRSSDEGRSAVYAVSEQLSPQDRQRAWSRLEQTPGIIRELELRYGPYPFGQTGGVALGVRFWWGALETQTRPVYAQMLATDDERTAVDLIAHEQSHMWFGDRVRVADWSDIVNNEGWATFAAQDVVARRYGEPMDDWLRQGWEGHDARFWEASIADPGLDNMFGTTYARGGLALQALRVVLGDEEFFAIARAWVAEPGARSVADFQAFVEQESGRDLTDFWAAWYDSRPGPPPKEAAYGWPG